MTQSAIKTIQDYVDKAHKRHNIYNTPAATDYRNVCAAIDEIRRAEATVRAVNDNQTTSVELFGRRFIPLPVDPEKKAIDLGDIVEGYKYGSRDFFTVGQIVVQANQWIICEGLHSPAYYPENLRHHETEAQKVERLLRELVDKASDVSGPDIGQIVAEYTKKVLASKPDET